MAPRMKPRDPTEIMKHLVDRLSNAIDAKGHSIAFTKKEMDSFTIGLDLLDDENKHLPPLILESILEQLGRGSNTCELLSAPAFGIVLEVILLGEDGSNKQAAMHLLSASLSSAPTEKKKYLGGLFLLRLMCLLTATIDDDDKLQHETRRIIGVLIVQLLRNSEENTMFAQGFPEDLRRSIGTAITQEPDIIVRTIFGHIIRSLKEEDLDYPLANLWPLTASHAQYEDFPIESQGDKDWNIQFQDFVDSHMSNPDLNTPPEPFFWCAAFECGGNGFVGKRRPICVYVRTEYLTVWSHRSDVDFDCFLDIPLQSLRHYRRILDADENDTGPQPSMVEFSVSSIHGKDCRLNGRKTDMHSILLIMFTSDEAESLVVHIQALVPSCRSAFRMGTSARGRTYDIRGRKFSADDNSGVSSPTPYNRAAISHDELDQPDSGTQHSDSPPAVRTAKPRSSPLVSQHSNGRQNMFLKTSQSIERHEDLCQSPFADQKGHVGKNALIMDHLLIQDQAASDSRTSSPTEHDRQFEESMNIYDFSDDVLCKENVKTFDAISDGFLHDKSHAITSGELDDKATANQSIHQEQMLRSQCHSQGNELAVTTVRKGKSATNTTSAKSVDEGCKGAVLNPMKAPNDPPPGADVSADIKDAASPSHIGAVLLLRQPDESYESEQHVTALQPLNTKPSKPTAKYGKANKLHSKKPIRKKIPADAAPEDQPAPQKDDVDWEIPISTMKKGPVVDQLKPTMRKTAIVAKRPIKSKKIDLKPKPQFDSDPDYTSRALKRPSRARKTADTTKLPQRPSRSTRTTTGKPNSRIEELSNEKYISPCNTNGLANGSRKSQEIINEAADTGGSKSGTKNDESAAQHASFEMPMSSPQVLDSLAVIPDSHFPLADVLIRDQRVSEVLGTSADGVSLNDQLFDDGYHDDVLVMESPLISHSTPKSKMGNKLAAMLAITGQGSQTELQISTLNSDNKYQREGVLLKVTSADFPTTNVANPICEGKVNSSLLTTNPQVPAGPPIGEHGQALQVKSNDRVQRGSSSPLSVEEIRKTTMTLPSSKQPHLRCSPNFDPTRAGIRHAKTAQNAGSLPTILSTKSFTSNNLSASKPRIPQLSDHTQTRTGIRTSRAVTGTPMFQLERARKTAVISFSRTGPKNQGTLNPAIKPSWDAGRISPEHKNVNSGFPGTGTGRIATITPQDITLVDDADPFFYDEIEACCFGPQPSLLTRKVRPTVSSQGSRVDENGSPLAPSSKNLRLRAPIRRYPASDVEPKKRISHVSFKRGNEGLDEVAGISLARQSSDVAPLIHMSGKDLRKARRPGSPSVFVQQENERIDHIHGRVADKMLANLSTNRVLPTLQAGPEQNPFQERRSSVKPSAFIKKLRETGPGNNDPSIDNVVTIDEAKHIFETFRNEQAPAKRRKTHAFDNEETLINDDTDGREPRNAWKVRGSASGMSSPPSSTSSCAPGEEPFTAEKRWAASLQPRHQSLFSAYSIAINTILGTLIDKEEAVKVVTEDFHRVGYSLLQDIVQTTRRDLISNQKAFDVRSSEIEKSCAKLMTNREIGLSFQTTSLKNAQKLWMNKQRGLLSMLQTGKLNLKRA